ncbi:MAG: effector-associated domain EAD1-containing protein [Acidobacteriota bacterium]
MTFPEFRKQGFLAEVSALFNQQQRAVQFLTTFGFPPGRIPNFEDAQVFWTTISRDIEGGIMPDDNLASLIHHAADYYPGNPLFSPFAVSRTLDPPVESAEQTADESPAASPIPEREGCSMVLGPPLEGEDAAALQRRVAQLCSEQGVSAEFEVMQVLEDGQVELYFPGTHADELQPVQENLRGQRIRCRLIDDRHRDRILSHLLIEGPDQARFRISDVPASTLVGDIARDVINSQYESNWPKDGRNRPRQATVDHVDDQGNERRLRPDDRLDDSRVEAGDTLQVHPESTAGSQNPIYQDEALVRAKNQVRRYAKSRSGFQVKANSTHAPTEYVIYFDAPGIHPHEQGLDSVRHSVLLQLSEQFPSVSPAVWWQPPVIFHPNVHMGTGKVCIGVLDDRYRPGLDFGRLCQMLVDIASFRNYVVTEGYNLQACQWAASEAGQATIVAGGGRPEDPVKLAQARGHWDDEEELPRREPGVSPMSRIEKLQT